jgi:hypothetical protein
MRTASGASRMAVSTKPYQTSFRRTPPAWNRLRMLAVGLRRMSG